MDKTEVYEKIEELIAEHFCVHKDQVKPNSHFRDDLGADSLDVIEITMMLEEEFDITIIDEEAEKIETVQEAADHVASMMN